MAFSFRKMSKRFFISSNLLVSVLFLLACLQPWLNPESFWLISFLSLTIPYLCVLLLLFVVFWFFFKIKYTLISIITLLLGWQQLSVLVATHNPDFSKRKPANTQQLRIFTWNVKAMKGNGAQDPKTLRKTTRNMYALIKAYRADVVCFQEFGQFDKPHEGHDNIQWMKELGFPYYVMSKDYSRVAWKYTSGVAIFSRYPIVFKKRVPFTSSPESLLFADIAWKKDTIRIFTSHLQSFKLLGNDFAHLEQAAGNNSEELVEASSNIFQKMKRAFRNRGAQADQIRPVLDSSHYPAIFCGDVNDVPGSYAYWQLRGSNWQDAFLKKGFGIGRTYMGLVPTLRIDYIFANPKWEVTQCATVPSNYSDHLPVVADLQLLK